MPNVLDHNAKFLMPEDYSEYHETPAPNDYTAIKWAIENAAAYNKIVFFEAGKTYNVEQYSIEIPSNTRIIGNNAVINVQSSQSLQHLFIIPDNNVNVSIEGVIIATKRDKRGGFRDIAKRIIGGNEYKYFVHPPMYTSGIDAVCICGGVENIIIQNCQFYGVTTAIHFNENIHGGDYHARHNIIIRDIIAKRVSFGITGGRETYNTLIENVHIETAPTNKLNHAIYLNQGHHDLRIRDFYIKQYPTEGHPVDIYNRNELTREPRSSHVFISNGEVHSGSLGDTTREYYIHCDNVKVYNDNDFVDKDDFLMAAFGDIENQSERIAAYNEYILYFKRYREYVDGSELTDFLWFNRQDFLELNPEMQEPSTYWIDVSGNYYNYYNSSNNDGIDDLNKKDEGRIAFTFWEESFGEFDNCELVGNITRGIYRNCFFKANGYSDFVVLEAPYDVDITEQTAGSTGSDLVVLENCTVNVSTKSAGSDVSFITAGMSQQTDEILKVIVSDTKIYFDVATNAQIVHPQNTKTACNVKLINCYAKNRVENGRLYAMRGRDDYDSNKNVIVTQYGCFYEADLVGTKTKPHFVENVVSEYTI